MLENQDALLTPEVPSPTEVAISAANIDFVEVARRTSGTLSFGKGNAAMIGWRRRASLEWRDENGQEGQKTLFFWRGEWGGGGMERCGLVTGENFVAFVYPNPEERFLKGELISQGEVSSFYGPEGMYNPVFLQAREIALKSADELFKKIKP